MKKLRFIALALSIGLFACSEEKSKPLPELAKIDVPAELAGQYSGQLPCEGCKALLVRVVFATDSSATIVRNIIKDSITVDTLQGAYSVGADGVVSLSADNGNKWKFKRSSLGNLSLLNGAGEIHVDDEGLKRELVRIFTVPKMKVVKDTASSKESE